MVADHVLEGEKNSDRSPWRGEKGTRRDWGNGVARVEAAEEGTAGRRRNNGTAR